MDQPSTLSDSLVSAPTSVTGSQTHGQTRSKDRLHLFEQLREKVLAQRPVLSEIIRRWGQKTLFDYAKDYFSVNLNPPIKFRQDELISTIHAMVTESSGKELADTAAHQLQKYYFVNTQDHLGPITHPWSFNANLLIAAPYLEQNDPDLKAVISLACANVSLNNTSFPRGLLFNSCKDGIVKTHRLSFLPSNSHSCSAYGFRAYTDVDIQKMRKLLRQLVRDGEVNVREGNMITALLDEIYDRPEILACKDYASQIVRTNQQLWKKFFPTNGNSHPQLINLQQEELVVRLITDFHLHQDTTINHLLFDPHYDPLVKNYFDGVLNAFTTADNRGTYLFWGVDKGNYRVQLWKRDSALVSSDGSMRIELTPESLQAAMQSKKIVPSIMLNFMVLSFYYGLKCLGGFSQVNYLTFMKNAYIKMQVDRGNYKSIEVCARAQTKEMVDATVAYLRAPNGSLIPATGLDFILYGDQDRWKYINEELKVMTVEDSVNPGMPDFYRFMYVGADADPTLMSMTPAEIATLTGLNLRTKAFAQIRDYPFPGPA